MKSHQFTFMYAPGTETLSGRGWVWAAAVSEYGGAAGFGCLLYPDFNEKKRHIAAVAGGQGKLYFGGGMTE